MAHSKVSFARRPSSLRVAIWFENQISTLTIQDRRATLTFRKAVLNRAGEPDLEEIYERRLA